MEHTENRPLFIIDDEPTVDWPVIVRLPQAGGTFAEYQFSVTMRVLSPSQYEALLKDAPSAKTVIGEKEIPTATELSDVVNGNVPIFQKLISGWTGPKDRDGNDVPFTAERLAEQITGPRGPALSAGLWRAINEVRWGASLKDGTVRDGARQGN